MREDQIIRLDELSEEIGDIFLYDANPENWTGTGIKPSDLSPQERGDAYWCRKVAIQTGSLLARVLDLAERDKNNVMNPVTPDDADKELHKFEKQAKELLRIVGGKS